MSYELYVIHSYSSYDCIFIVEIWCKYIVFGDSCISLVHHDFLHRYESCRVPLALTCRVETQIASCLCYIFLWTLSVRYPCAEKHFTKMHFRKQNWLVQHFRTASCTLRLHSAWHTFCECFLKPSRFHGSNVWGVKIAGGVAKQLTWCTWRRPVIMEKTCGTL